jgi:hypothetical protein
MGMASAFVRRWNGSGSKLADWAGITSAANVAASGEVVTKLD